MKKIILAGILLCLMHFALAQTSTYTFIKEGGQISYLDPNDTGVHVHVVMDDIVLPAKAAIGFPFKFNGVFYDSVGISENGYIWFGPAQSDALSGIVNPLTATLPPGVEGVVCAFGIDLHPHTNTGLTTSIRSKTVIFGAHADNFIVEWRNTTRLDAMNDLAGEDTIGFQIQLFQFELDRVQITYGYDIGLNPNISSQISVGIKGGDNTDFSVRMTDSTHNWDNTLPGPVIHSRCSFDTQNNPGKASFNYMSWLNTGATGLQKLPGSDVNVYPVPVTERLYITSKGTIEFYEVLGIDAKVRLSGNWEDSGLDVNSLPAGMYVLRIMGSEGLASVRFIKR
ncbi:MAG: T9SS type A sorting domain-containing protein [Bacteroidia bacterium]